MIVVRIWFLLLILRMNGRNLTKVCIHISIDEIYIGIVNNHFSQTASKLLPLIDLRIWFLLNIFEMNGHNLTNVCIHIIY